MDRRQKGFDFSGMRVSPYEDSVLLRHLKMGGPEPRTRMVLIPNNMGMLSVMHKISMRFF